MKKYAILGLAFLMTACSTAKLSSGGSHVEYVNQLDRKGCKNLGPVFGKGGGQFGGAWISDENLMEYAVNDIRNKAAERGATHVVAQTHQMGNTSSASYYGGGGTTSTATISGVAYRCPREE
jgi:hypothetical protein